MPEGENLFGALRSAQTQTGRGPSVSGPSLILPAPRRSLLDALLPSGQALRPRTDGRPGDRGGHGRELPGPPAALLTW